MSTNTTRGPIKALVAVTYLAMVAMNFLANALPLNGRRTGDISDAYPSLFTPAESGRSAVRDLIAGQHRMGVRLAL